MFFALLSQYREETRARLTPSHLFEEKLGLSHQPRCTNLTRPRPWLGRDGVS